MKTKTQTTYISPTASCEIKYSPAALLIDQFGRNFNYLRIAINENCNLRCIYCMPEKGIASDRLKNTMNPNEISRILKVSSDLGVNKVRFTGGEPLMHPHIISLVEMASNTPQIDSVHLTTNAVFLKKMVGELKYAGLQGINISIDTLDTKKYLRMTRRNTLNQAIEGLEAAISAGIPSIKINVVVLRGFNDSEFKDFAELTREHSITVRFIELMPFDAQQIWKTGKFMSAQHIKQNLKQYFPNISPADGSRTEHTVYKIPGYKGKIAVIPAFSRSLCGQCNRIRITADGKIRNCLFTRDENNILGLMQRGGTDDDMKTMLLDTMWKKVYDGWEAENSGIEMRNSMAQIGG
jgi:cyclic pyranopterin phosphate synthase